MGIYFKKSIKVGPMRFNFSKSGVGVSTGVKGFRVGTGPRGNYIHIGRKGYQYRKTFSNTNHPEKESTPERIPSEIETRSSVKMEEIDTENVLELVDSSSKELLEEINSKIKKPRFFLFSMIVSLFILIVLMIAKAPGWIILGILLLATVGCYFVYQADQLKKTVVLFYDLDEDVEKVFETFHDAFTELATCTKTWHISASGNVTNLQEWKKQAGATRLIRRNGNKVICESPPFIKTNVKTPSISVGSQVLYFFPDRVLVYENKNVGAVSYEHLIIEMGQTRFIESEYVPSDSKIVDYTWQYVNKKGGPDRRYKDNKKLPIALYSEVFFKSKSGLNELIQLSKPVISNNFADSIKELATLTT